MGFNLVLHGATLHVGQTRVTLSHCPLLGVRREIEEGSQRKLVEDGESWHNESKFEKFSTPDYGQYHVHGHCHLERKFRIRDRQFDVGVRANKYKPVPMSEIESWIGKRERVKDE